MALCVPEAGFLTFHDRARAHARCTHAKSHTCLRCKKLFRGSFQDLSNHDYSIVTLVFKTVKFCLVKNLFLSYRVLGPRRG